MNRHTFGRALAAFAARQRRVLLVLLLALTAAGGYGSWKQPARPRASWNIQDPGQTRLTSDGKLLLGLSGKLDRTHPIDCVRGVGPVRLWDAVTGTERVCIQPDQEQFAAAQLSPDGHCLAVADEQGGLTLCDPNTGQFRGTLALPVAGSRPNACWDLHFSPDSRLLAHASTDGQAVVLWDVVSGKAWATLDGARPPFAFSPDGQTLGAATEEAVGQLWDTTTGRVRARLRKSALPAAAFAFSPNGTLLATEHRHPAGEISEVNVWEVATGELWAHLPVAAGPSRGRSCAHRLTFSPDSRILVASSASSESPLWDVRARPPNSLGLLCDQYINQYPRMVFAAGSLGPRRWVDPAFSQDGRWLVVPGGQVGTYSVLHAATLAQQALLEAVAVDANSGQVYPAPDGRTFAVEVFYGVPSRSGRPRWLRRLLPHTSGSPVTSAVKLFEAETGRLLREVPGEWWGGFTPDGRAFFTTIPDAMFRPSRLTVQRWDVDAPMPVGLYVCVIALVLMAVGLLKYARERYLKRDRTGTPVGSPSP
jgi:WD40 repeat protein